PQAGPEDRASPGACGTVGAAEVAGVRPLGRRRSAGAAARPRRGLPRRPGAAHGHGQRRESARARRSAARSRARPLPEPRALGRPRQSAPDRGRVRLRTPPAGAFAGDRGLRPPVDRRAAGRVRRRHRDVSRGGTGGSPATRSGCPDLNWGPLRPERSALPGCATPRAVKGELLGSVTDIRDEAVLREVIGTPTELVLTKIADRLNALTRQFVERSP